MAKTPNHEAEMGNANKGTPGQNKTHAANEGNRGKEMNPEIAKPSKPALKQK